VTIQGELEEGMWGWEYPVGQLEAVVDAQGGAVPEPAGLGESCGGFQGGVQTVHGWGEKHHLCWTASMVRSEETVYTKECLWENDYLTCKVETDGKLFVSNYGRNADTKRNTCHV